MRKAIRMHGMGVCMCGLPSTKEEKGRHLYVPPIWCGSGCEDILDFPSQNSTIENRRNVWSKSSASIKLITFYGPSILEFCNGKVMSHSTASANGRNTQLCFFPRTAHAQNIAGHSNHISGCLNILFKNFIFKFQ